MILLLLDQQTAVTPTVVRPSLPRAASAQLTVTGDQSAILTLTPDPPN